jgi:peptidoglycan/xylan/chitin deacetylase (PgdA/CDA1 family)
MFTDTIKRKGPPVQCVGLTFDDGPHPVYSRLICDVLAKHNAKGTFFMTGGNLTLHKELAREMALAGHEIGSHCFSHTNPLFMTPKKCHDEISKTRALVEDVTGRACRFVRPPFGMVTPWLVSSSRRLGMTVILWNVNSFDFRRRPHRLVAARVNARVGPGSIVLFHECHFKEASRDYSGTAQALELVLQFLAEKKLSAVTIGELLVNEAQGERQ